MGQLSPVQSRRDKITKDYYIRYSASSLVCTWRTLEEIKGTCEWNLNLAAREEEIHLGRLEGNWKIVCDILEEKYSFFCIQLAVFFKMTRRRVGKSKDRNMYIRLLICFTKLLLRWMIKRLLKVFYLFLFRFISSKCSCIHNKK